MLGYAVGRIDALAPLSAPQVGYAIPRALRNNPLRRGRPVIYEE